MDGSALALETRGLLSAHHVSVDGWGGSTPQLSLTHSSQPIEPPRRWRFFSQAPTSFSPFPLDSHKSRSLFACMLCPARRESPPSDRSPILLPVSGCCLPGNRQREQQGRARQGKCPLKTAEAIHSSDCPLLGRSRCPCRGQTCTSNGVAQNGLYGQLLKRALTGYQKAL